MMASLIATGAPRGALHNVTSARVMSKLPALGLLAVVGVLVVLPLFRLQEIAIADGGSGYARAFGTPRFGEVLWMTVVLAVGSVLIALVLGTVLAWAATRLPKGFGFLAAVPIFPIVLPAAANVVGWAFLLSPRPGYLNSALRHLPWWNHLTEGPVDIYTLPWIVILTGFSLTAFVFLFVSNGLRNVSAELQEAARASGSSSAGTFFKVTLPLLRPSLLYGAGVALLLGLGQFTAPLFLGRNEGIDVLTTLMYRYVSQTPIDHGAAAALSSPLLLFGVAIVLVQKLMLGDQSRFVTHGGKSSFRAAGRPSYLAALTIMVFGLVSTALPLGALLLVALSPFWSGTVDPSVYTLDNFREVVSSPGIMDAISLSVVATVAAVAIALPLGFAAATLLLRGRRRSPVLASVVDFLVSMPLGIPAVIFGAGFLLTYTRPPVVLYGSSWVIILVYVTLMLPFTTRMQLTGMVALGDGYIEASRTSGAGPLRTNLQVVFPLMRSTLAGTAALMFVLLIHEFSASLLVRSPTTQVMGTLLYDYWTNGQFPLVAAIALVMGGVTVLGLGAALAFGGSDVLKKL